MQKLKKELQNVPINLTWEDDIGKLQVFSKKLEKEEIIEAIEADEKAFFER